MYQCFNWYNFTWLSGDHIVEQFIHSLDKLLWLHHDEPPVRCYGLGGRAARDAIDTGDIYDHFHVVYEWADGSRSYANTRQISQCKNETEDYVFGTEGSARLIAHEILGSNPWKFTGKKVQMHQAEQDEFALAMRGDRSRINNGRYMSYSTLLAIMGREACYSGGVITWDQALQSPQRLGPTTIGPDAEAPSVNIPVPGVYKFPVG
jgi:predicted dehydrogenase